MNEPLVRYARRPDGKAVAFVEFGAGKPFIYVSSAIWSHVTAFWRVPGYREMFEAMAERRTIYMYDSIGSGLSEREGPDFSLESQLQDLQAVIDAAGLTRFTLSANGLPGAVALTYAARFPERVSHLVLFDPVVRGVDYLAQPATRALESYREIAREDWYGYVNTLAFRLVSFDNVELGRSLARVLSDSSSPETLERYQEDVVGIDATDALADVRCPVLVLSYPRQPGVTPEFSRAVTEGITHAHAVQIEAQTRFPLPLETIELVEAFQQEHE